MTLKYFTLNFIINTDQPLLTLEELNWIVDHTPIFIADGNSFKIEMKIEGEYETQIFVNMDLP